MTSDPRIKVDPVNTVISMNPFVFPFAKKAPPMGPASKDLANEER